MDSAKTFRNTSFSVSSENVQESFSKRQDSKRMGSRDRRRSGGRIRNRKDRFQSIKSTTLFLSLAVCALVVTQYWRGDNSIPQDLILLLVGQVMSRAIIRICAQIHEVLSRRARNTAVPSAVFSVWLVELDTELQGRFSIWYSLCNTFVTLILLYTPEQAVGLWASGRKETRLVNPQITKVELASFAGGFNKSSYYTTGQLLLSSSLPPSDVYGEVAYLHGSTGPWILPRKPTLWYKMFAHNMSRQDNNKEVNIVVWKNEAVRLDEVRIRDFEKKRCRKIGNLTSSYGFSLQMSTCGNVIQFQYTSKENAGGVRGGAKAFLLQYGFASVKYSVEGNLRRIKNWEGEFEYKKTLIFPNPDAFWEDMGKCFLNAFSFNKPELKPDSPVLVLDRIMISALVRVDWVESNHSGGFSKPPKIVDAQVSKVVTSNIPLAVVIIVVVCCVVLGADAVAIVCLDQVGSFALRDVMHYGAVGKQNYGEWIRVRTGERTWWELGRKDQLVDELGDQEAKTTETSVSAEDTEGHASTTSSDTENSCGYVSDDECEYECRDVKCV